MNIVQDLYIFIFIFLLYSSRTAPVKLVNSSSFPVTTKNGYDEDILISEIPVVKTRGAEQTGPIQDKYLEIIIALDQSTLDFIDSGEMPIKNFLRNFLPYYNHLMSQLGIHVFVKRLIHLPRDKFAPSLTISMRDYNDRVADFNSAEIEKTYSHDYLLAFTSNHNLFPGDSLGNAVISGICYKRISMSLLRFRPASRNRMFTGKELAAIAAHETGHSLGLKHEFYYDVRMEDGKIPRGYGTCKANLTFETCIMQGAYIAGQIANQWSGYSIDEIRKIEAQGLLTCLRNEPSQSDVKSTEYPVCGNGIVETGETCDCLQSDDSCSRQCNIALNGCGQTPGGPTTRYSTCSTLRFTTDYTTRRPPCTRSTPGDDSVTDNISIPTDESNRSMSSWRTISVVFIVVLVASACLCCSIFMWSKLQGESCQSSQSEQFSLH